MENDNSNELVLSHVNVIFTELKDTGFGRSITIDVTDDDLRAKIEAWVKENNINGGKAKIKDYTNEKTGVTTKQYQLRLSDYTDIDGKDGLGEKDLGYGAVINLCARPFEYDNKFGKGISASLRGVFIVEPRKNTVMDKIAE